MFASLAFPLLSSLSQAVGVGLRPRGREVAVEQLMDRYAAGDTASFDALYPRISPKIFGDLLRLCRNRTSGEDPSQGLERSRWTRR